VTAEESAAMLENCFKDASVEMEARKRMKALNDAILEVEDLNENYQIGAAYFRKANEMSFDELWTDCLQPVLLDYVRGMYDEAEIMKKFAKAYGYEPTSEEDADED
jgi:TnpA family transposase